MRKHCKENTMWRAAFAAHVAMLLCVFFFLPVSAKKKQVVPVAVSTINLNELMSDWVAIPLSQMIGTAELVVWGNVKSVGDSSYVFRVSKRLSGTSKAGTVEVLKVTPDRFASTKQPPYERGQCFILFLIQENNNQKHSQWRVMGMGGEGQMPVVNNYVYFAGNNINGIEFNNYTVNGTEQYVQRFDFSLVMNAVEEYRKCFHWTKNEMKKRYTPQKICDDSTLTEFSRKSFIHSYLSVQTKLILDNK